VNPIHATLAAVAALAAAGAVQGRGSRSATLTAMAVRYAPLLIDYGIKVVASMTRSQIKQFLSLDREGQVALIRRRLLFSPGVGWAVRAYIGKGERAESLAGFIEDFLREHGEDSVKLATKIAAQQAKLRKGAANRGGLNQLQHLLALLRTLRWHYHTTHWRVQGKSFYGDHLMFERLYQGEPSLDDEIDKLGEKMVTLYGRDAVASQTIWPEATRSLESAIQQSDCPYRQALALEGEVQQTLKSAYDTLKAEGKLTAGMDDYLLALANERDTATYLLKQRLSEKT
jgi:DNA-binding ferritin-like protein